MHSTDKRGIRSVQPTRSASAERTDAEEVVQEYFYLLEDVPSLDGIPKELHETVGRLLNILTKAHAMSIVYYLFCEQRPLRFKELEDVTGASPKVLSQRLKEFVEAGLITRRSYDESPPHVEYESTVMAKELDPALQFLYAWAWQWGEALPAGPIPRLRDE
jgi:DNA-binding HxlR family transcriptional regulator